jgi:hypothetical protein
MSLVNAGYILPHFKFIYLYVISNNHAVVAFSDTVLNIYIKTMTEDDDKEVVAQACMSVADIVKDCGFAAIEPCKLHLYNTSWPQNTRLCC